MLHFGLKDDAIQKICAVLAQYPQVEKALLYGSRAKGNFKPGSDIDLTLQGDKRLTLPVLNQVATALDDLLLPYTIELSIYSAINEPEMQAHIERVGVLFYQKKSIE